jgi:hypothetical protein
MTESKATAGANQSPQARGVDRHSDPTRCRGALGFRTLIAQDRILAESRNGSPSVAYEANWSGLRRSMAPVKAHRTGNEE